MIVGQPYTYLETLFKLVLTGSEKIQGRFYTSSKYGAQEINFDVVSELVADLPQNKKYPLTLMPPPHSYGKLTDKLGEWEEFRIILFFVETTYYQGSTIPQQNAKTKTSGKSVQESWNDMSIASKDFIRGLNILQRKSVPAYFRIPNHSILSVPVSSVGVDRVSGIKIAFDMQLFVGCEITDYPDNYFKNLDIDGL